jgi:Na+/H+ antiporter NhaD/arsenite permease-like protein
MNQTIIIVEDDPSLRAILDSVVYVIPSLIVLFILFCICQIVCDSRESEEVVPEEQKEEERRVPTDDPASADV